MICVVIGHCDITDDYKKLWIFKWVYSFHMPVFFFISGYLFALTNPKDKTEQNSTIKFLKKKFKRLFIPFLFINSVIFLIKATLINDKNMMQHPVSLNIKSFIYSTFIHPLGFMWFLPALLVIFCIIYPLHSHMQEFNHKYSIILLLMAIASGVFYAFIPSIEFMQISRGIYYSSYFILGILYYIYKSYTDYVIKKFWYVLLPLFISISVSLIFPKYISAISGILMCTIIGLLFEKKCNTTLINLSELCYSVFLLSYFPQMLIRGPIAHTYNHINQYLLSALSFFVGIGIPIIIGLFIIKLSKKNNFLKKTSFILGI